MCACVRACVRACVCVSPFLSVCLSFLSVCYKLYCIVGILYTAVCRTRVSETALMYCRLLGMGDMSLVFFGQQDHHRHLKMFDFFMTALIKMNIDVQV